MIKDIFLSYKDFESADVSLPFEHFSCFLSQNEVIVSLDDSRLVKKKFDKRKRERITKQFTKVNPNFLQI
jgi:hypothetical protein